MMTPDSRPCMTLSRSRRCSPMQIRFVTQNMIGGSRITANRMNQVIQLTGISKIVAKKSLPPAIHSKM